MSCICVCREKDRESDLFVYPRRKISAMGILPHFFSFSKLRFFPVQGDSRAGDDAGTVWCGDLNVAKLLSIDIAVIQAVAPRRHGSQTSEVQKIYGIRGGYKGVAWRQTKDKKDAERWVRMINIDKYRCMMCL